MQSMTEENNSADEDSTQETKCRWSSYSNYRLVVWVWMMNEVAIVFSPTELAHNGYYFHAFLQTLGIIFVGIPLVYSEITLAQYTNCGVFTMWNFFPLFRYVGYGTIFLIILKTIYIMVLASWFLIYTFYSAFDPPPWFSCDSFTGQKCMIKSVNVSIFQHCLEAQTLFGDDCGMKTASFLFYDREIGEKNTVLTPTCFLSWKSIIACSTVSFLMFILSIRKEKLMQVVLKLLAGYLFVVVLILFSVALSSSGTWHAATVYLHWTLVFFTSIFNSITRGVLSVGTGCGIIIFISRDVSFRSPATMTSIMTSLLSHALTLMFGLVAFSGIKTMSFFHGEEEFILEVDDSIYFTEFASMTEIMTYFYNYIWGFLWFSAITLCLICNIWILHFYLGDIMFEYKIARKYKNVACAVLLFLISFVTWPFFCSDLTGALTDAAEIIQLMNNFFLSISLYWIYGYHNHSIDIIFMIGVKPSYFWKIAWILNPIALIVIICYRFKDLQVRTYGESYKLTFVNVTIGWMLLYVLLGIYVTIIIVGILFQLFVYYRHGKLRDVFRPTECWGPRDMVLFKSRKMFIPDIMTTEFLYRQVRIRGYGQKKASKHKKRRETVETFHEEVEWSAFTSN